MLWCTSPYAEISWTIPTYHAINAILGNPVYAGVYAFGKSRQESYLNEHGELKKRVVKLPQEKWAVFIQEHHKGFIDWQTYQNNQARLQMNTRPLPHNTDGALREGQALLQGIALRPLWKKTTHLLPRQVSYTRLPLRWKKYC